MDTWARTALSPSNVSIRKPTRSPPFRISAVVKPRIRASESFSATRRTTVVFPAPGVPVRSRAFAELAVRISSPPVPES
jgi:hypothetical protein